MLFPPLGKSWFLVVPLGALKATASTEALKHEFFKATMPEKLTAWLLRAGLWALEGP